MSFYWGWLFQLELGEKRSYTGLFTCRFLEDLKLIFVKLVREFVRLIKNWEVFKSIRALSTIFSKVTKNFFGLSKIHRYTKKSVEKFVVLMYFLDKVVLKGFKKKEALQRLAEW